MKIDIKKRKGIDKFVSEYVPKKVEECSQLTVQEREVDYPRLLKSFKRHIDGESVISSNTIEECIHREEEFLSQEEIDFFFQLTSVFKEHPKYHNVESFLHVLLQDSHAHGNNNFFLNTEKNKISVGSFLRVWHNTMYIRIDGDTNELGRGATNVNITQNGNCRSCGDNAIRSSFKIRGDTNHAAVDAIECDFQIHGDVKYVCGRSAKETAITVHGDVLGDFGQYSEDCVFLFHGRIGRPRFLEVERFTFKTTNKETLSKLRRSVYDNNELVYITADGEEITGQEELCTIAESK